MISFVYFDLGGVVTLDFNETDKWQELKRELGIPSEKYKEFDVFFQHYEGEVCVGRDVESLIPLIKKKFKVKVTEGYSLLIDGFIKRFEKNKSIWPVIDEIRKHCEVGLLTNQYPHMFESLKKRRIIPDVAWDVIVDSSMVGLKKPDLAIFKLAEKEAGVSGSKILFIENSKSHIVATEAFGWRTFWYHSSNPERSSFKLKEFFHRSNNSLL
ncbi:HAD-IA family hydrolase [Candidatus Roizmanbacteria bacterium]|nr:HAD-IA family hydrolase [Candidatus Roizmanbacteria bacterium]